MKYPSLALLLCLSLWAAADELSQPFDVIGTPLQQEFKYLYREVHKAETLYVDDYDLRKRVGKGWRDRATKFIGHDLLMPLHPCIGVNVPNASPGLSYQKHNKDDVTFLFECTEETNKRISGMARLYLKVENGESKYLVDFYWRMLPENYIWDD